MTSAQQQMIFNPFFKVSKDGNTPGMGLGLSIVVKAVELMGGNISVESLIGEGSTFTIIIPNIMPIHNGKETGNLSLPPTNSPQPIASGER